MHTRIPICYLILIYTLLAVFTRGAEEPLRRLHPSIGASGETLWETAGGVPVAAREPRLSHEDGPGVIADGPGTRNESVPEPGAIGLVAILVVLLALQRRRD